LENIRKRADDVRFIIRDENRDRSQRFNLSRKGVRKEWRFELDGSPKHVQDVGYVKDHTTDQVNGPPAAPKLDNTV
jgi:hypothetical protein